MVRAQGGKTSRQSLQKNRRNAGPVQPHSQDLSPPLMSLFAITNYAVICSLPELDTIQLCCFLHEAATMQPRLVNANQGTDLLY